LSEVFRCADVSEGRSEPLFATASHVPNWLLLEQPGGWGYDAVTQSRLDPAIGKALAEKARAQRIRMILIKRGARFAGRQPQAFLCHVAPNASFLERVPMDEPEDLLDLDFGAVRRGRPGQGKRVNEPLYLVCTHGRHDACCSIRGNPVSRTLCAVLPGRAWEASHIGGDRFAANIVCLPHGVYYGRVHVDDVMRLVDGLDRGLLDLRFYRGLCCYSFPVQAAEFFVRREMNLDHLADLTLSSAVRIGDAILSATFDLSGRAVTARVGIKRDIEAFFLTCKATVKGHPPRYELLSLAAGTGETLPN
jgi:hypothetical protein